MNIPFFRYPHVFEHHREIIEKALISVSAKGAYILQSELQTFEDRIAEYCGAEYAIGVGNGTDGLEMIVQAVGLGPGDEVLLPSHTFIASASPIVTHGAVPVLVEIADDHLMDPEDIEHRITSRTRAIMPIQLNGRTADMDRIIEIAEKQDLILIEDSAQGLGSRYRGKMAGTFGVAGIYSFYPAKTLGCLGDGGVIVTDDDDLARIFRQLRDHGRDESTGEVVRWGRNSRLDNLQAAVLLAKLDLHVEEIEIRRNLARRYHQNLKNLSQLLLPPPPEDGDNPVHFDVYQNYEIEAEDRDTLGDYIKERGVGTLVQWGGKGIHQYPALGIKASLPGTEEMLRKALMLPMNSSLTGQEVDYICEQVIAFYSI